jgi:hypothetical protein
VDVADAAFEFLRFKREARRGQVAEKVTRSPSGASRSILASIFSPPVGSWQVGGRRVCLVVRQGGERQNAA